MMEVLLLELQEQIAHYLSELDLRSLSVCSSRYRDIYEPILWTNVHLTSTKLLQQEMMLSASIMKKLDQYTTSIHFRGMSFHNTKKRPRKMVPKNCGKIMAHCKPSVISVTGIPVQQYLAPAFTNLSGLIELHLEFIHNTIAFDDDFFTRICKEATQLVVLEMNSSVLTENALMLLPQLSTLRRFTLQTFSEYCKVSDRGLSAISELVNLTKLKLHGTRWSKNTKWDCMARMIHLRFLCLPKSLLNEASLLHISTLPCLEVLDISECDVADESIALIASLPSLKKLNIGHTQTTDSSIYHFQKLKHLQVLFINDTRISDVSVSYIASLPSLRVIDISDARVSQAGFIEALCIKSIKTVYCRNIVITDADALCKAIVGFHTLERRESFHTNYFPHGIYFNRFGMAYQPSQDDALSHSSNVCQNYLHVTLSRGHTISKTKLQPKSSDLNVLDYYFWNKVKEIVMKTSEIVQNVEQLK